MSGFLRLVILLWLTTISPVASEWEVVISPRTTVDERDGVTGGGCMVKSGDRVLSFFPDHPDDFGGSAGMASAISNDGGATWSKGPNNWPMPGMIDLWADRLASGDLLAFGIGWLPDPKNRRAAIPPAVPQDAYRMGLSKDGGRTWDLARATIECPAEIGHIARPLPHIIESENGLLLMPAYTWSQRGNRAVLLQSEDRGRTWKVRSVITTAVAMIQAGAKVTTPWLESTVSFTGDDEMLAIVRSGSTLKSALVSVRSTDRGKSWGKPKVLPMAGKLPTLHLLDNGILTLTTALSRNHCRVYLSDDGTGRSWNDAFVISSLTGGNVGAAVAADDRLILASSAVGRIDAWHLQIRRKPEVDKKLDLPADLTFRKGTLSWSSTVDVEGWRITPVLIEPGPNYSATQVLPCAPILIAGTSTSLDLRRQLLPGSIYVFEVAAVDAEGRVSRAARSAEFQVR